MSRPSVSIICPYRNGAAFLPGLIATVCEQTHGAWELLLIDDGSSDGGAALARAAAGRDGRIRALTAPPLPTGAPSGPWWPRNHGLTRAGHDLIAFLDVDDRWHPAKLERQLEVHRRAGARVSVTGYARFDAATGRLLGWRLPPPRFGYRRLRCCNAIPMLTLVLDRQLLGEGFQPCPHEDYLRWLNLFREQPQLCCVTVPELLAFYSVHASNLTGRRWHMPVWAYRVYRSHGLGRLASSLSLLPWILAQFAAFSRTRRRPLRSSLHDALRAVPPWPLPPAGSS